MSATRGDKIQAKWILGLNGRDVLIVEIGSVFENDKDQFVAVYRGEPVTTYDDRKTARLAVESAAEDHAEMLRSENESDDLPQKLASDVTAINGLSRLYRYLGKYKWRKTCNPDGTFASWRYVGPGPSLAVEGEVVAQGDKFVGLVGDDEEIFDFEAAAIAGVERMHLINSVVKGK